MPTDQSIIPLRGREERGVELSLVLQVAPDTTFLLLMSLRNTKILVFLQGSPFELLS